MISRRALPWLALPALAQEAPVRILSGGALEPAVHAALALWTGTPPKVMFDTAPRMVGRLVAGEEYDLLLAPPETLQAVIRQTMRPNQPPQTAVQLGAVPVGVALREGAPTPLMTDEASFRAAVLAADALVFNQASTGLYMDRLFARLGLTAAIAAKSVRFATGDEVLWRIAAGQGWEIGFAATTEILLFRGRGVRLAGLLPQGLGNSTVYMATALSSRGELMMAFFTHPPVLAAMRAAGLE